MLLVGAIVLLFKQYGTQATPLSWPILSSSPTFNSPILARDDPSDGCNGRAVLDILWSCLATTFACTWVSVHPNVPFRNEGRWTIFRRRIYLMFFSILAPEFMIMWAFKQWRGARMIREAINKAIQEASPDPQNPIRKPWTTTHAHFLQMGGFRLSALACENFYLNGDANSDLRRRAAITALNSYESDDIAALGLRDRKLLTDLPDEDDRIATSVSRNKNLIPNDLHYRHEVASGSWVECISEDDASRISSPDLIWEGVLSIQALRALLSENLVDFPSITADQIEDKSKGDALSKGIALLQLTWFIVQIIARAVDGLAVTELELTTAALAGLNSIMYIFWWNKPRDVRFPVELRTKGVEGLLATNPGQIPWRFGDEEFGLRKHLWMTVATWIEEMVEAIGSFIVYLPEEVKRALSKLVLAVKVFPSTLAHIFSRISQKFARLSRKGTKSKPIKDDAQDADAMSRASSEREGGMKQTYQTFVAFAKTVLRYVAFPLRLLFLVVDLVVIIPIDKILRSSDDTSFSDIFSLGFDIDAEDEASSTIFYSEDAGVHPLLSTASIAGALFGAIHCLAWNFSFPSLAEKILWRTASLGVVGACALSCVVILTWDRLEKQATSEVKTVGSVLVFFTLILPAALIMILIPFVYPVARITLLVLAVISLRSLPLSAFDTVNWVEFVPHI